MRYSREHKLETHARIVQAGFGAAARKGRAWHRRRRSDEGRRADPWRLLCPFRFARGAGHRGVRSCDGSLDRALAQGGRSKLPPEKRLATIVESYLTPVHRDDPGHGCAMPTLGAEIARESPKTRKAFAAKLEADDRHAGRADSGCSAQGRAQAGDGDDCDHDGNAGDGPRLPAMASFPKRFWLPDARPCWRAPAPKRRQRKPRCQKGRRQLPGTDASRALGCPLRLDIGRMRLDECAVIARIFAIAAAREAPFQTP